MDDGKGATLNPLGREKAGALEQFARQTRRELIRGGLATQKKSTVTAMMKQEMET